MSTRGRGNKIIKKRVSLPSARRGSRPSSISTAAHDKLEHFAKHANSVVIIRDQDREDEKPDLEDDDDDDDAALSSPSSSSPVGEGEVEEGSSPSSSLESEVHARTAGEVAVEVYGRALKIDNAICRKLAGETALRAPTQRRADQKLNMERRSNVEALLAQMTGVPPARPCKNCYKGHGPWTTCVVYEGQMCGSCSNCWFNASGSRCTFHENNHPLLSNIYTGTASAAASAPSNLAAAADLDNWNVSAATKRLVKQTMSEVSAFNRRDRFLARIEAAAKELGMRIAEYEEWLKTPEGAEAQKADQASHYPFDSSMGEAP